MLKNYLSFLKSVAKKLAKEKNIFDIVSYGSFVKGKENPNDFDFALVFVNTPLSERLNIAQEFKEKIREKIKNPDVTTLNIFELFDSSFLARQGVLVEGISLLSSTSIAERLGFKGYSLFTYNLKNMTLSQKTRFTYSLSGRNNIGIIERLGAKHLGRGVIAIPIDKSAIFEDFLKEWKIQYEENKILISD